MKNIHFILVVFVLFEYASVNAQENFWNNPNAYLGQTPPGNTPVRFAPNLISDTSFFSLDRTTFSPDGKEFFYCNNNTWFSSNDATLRYYKYDGDKWQGPVIIAKQFYGPVMSANGKTLYFIGGGKGGVSAMYKLDTGWTAPTSFMKRNYGMYNFAPTASGRFYAASNIHGNANDFSCYDICLLPSSDKDTVAHTLGKPINTPGFDGDFFIAQDESYIVVSAKEKPDYECELFISYHKKDGGWTNPKSLGPLINNDPAHRWGEYVTPDNKYLFYSYGHGPKDCAIYWVRFDNLLESLRHTNFEPYVKDSISNQHASVNKTYSFTIPGNTFFDDDGNNTLTFSATLSNGNALPAWLKFDARKKIFTASAAAKGIYSIIVTATDNAKATASSVFLLTVGS